MALACAQKKIQPYGTCTSGANVCGRTKSESKTVRQLYQVPTTPLFLDTCH